MGSERRKFGFNFIFSEITKASVQRDFPHDGDETQKSWKPLLNTIFVFRGSAEYSVRRRAEQILLCIPLKRM